MVSYLMCENLLECFNSSVPQYIDKLVMFFYMLPKLFTLSTILWEHCRSYGKLYATLETCDCSYLAEESY